MVKRIVINPKGGARHAKKNKNTHTHTQGGATNHNVLLNHESYDDAMPPVYIECCKFFNDSS